METITTWITVENILKAFLLIIYFMIYTQLQTCVMHGGVLETYNLFTYLYFMQIICRDECFKYYEVSEETLKTL